LGITALRMFGNRRIRALTIPVPTNVAPQNLGTEESGRSLKLTTRREHPPARDCATWHNGFFASRHGEGANPSQNLSATGIELCRPGASQNPGVEDSGTHERGAAESGHRRIRAFAKAHNPA